ncbi:uncharacterized protein LOC116222955 [Clupea harengus]|uniref:Uncharacterized protein LOC116222955 n=1 Tax=Clupea harengus TaxID=7950 RepID=A0A6P8G2I0_CLUHA|nr:uncharacterized protein LOC116222955 [Clupea harengus]
MRRQERHREEKTDDVRVGTIMFGRGDIPGPVKGEGTRHIGEDTAEDGYNIQADAGGLVDGQDVIDDSSSSKAAWASMRPTVLCTKDLMKFSAQGPGSSSLQLDRAGGKPLSLNQLPQDCGYSVYRTELGLLFLIQYDGCDVINQGGNHLLQMLWQSNPVTLCCPMSSQASQSPMDPPLQPTPAPTEATSSTASMLPPQNQQQLMQQQQLKDNVVTRMW